MLIKALNKICKWIIIFLADLASRERSKETLKMLESPYGRSTGNVWKGELSFMNDPFSWIVGRMDALTNKEKRIASYILMNRDNVRYLTETEIEENCGVSRTSITRFLRALDYSSFRSLKHDLEIATCYGNHSCGQEEKRRGTCSGSLEHGRIPETAVL